MNCNNIKFPTLNLICFSKIIFVCHHIGLTVTENKLVEKSTNSPTSYWSNPEHPVVIPLILDNCRPQTSCRVDAGSWKKYFVRGNWMMKTSTCIWNANKMGHSNCEANKKRRKHWRTVVTLVHCCGIDHQHQQHGQQHLHDEASKWSCVGVDTIDTQSCVFSWYIIQDSGTWVQKVMVFSYSLHFYFYFPTRDPRFCTTI